MLKKEKTIRDYFIYKTKNMSINGNSNSSDRLASIFITADNMKEIERKILIIKNNLSAFDVNGNKLNIILK